MKSRSLTIAAVLITGTAFAQENETGAHFDSNSPIVLHSLTEMSLTNGAYGTNFFGIDSVYADSMWIDLENQHLIAIGVRHIEMDEENQGFEPVIDECDRDKWVRIEYRPLRESMAITIKPRTEE